MKVLCPGCFGWYETTPTDVPIPDDCPHCGFKPKGKEMSKTPTENMTCASCGLTVMMKGEHPTWKGVPMAPNSSELKWFCNEKLPCKEAMMKAIAQAERAWGGQGNVQAENPRGDNGGTG